MDVVGWVEKPQYDAGNQRLVWSLETRSRGVKDDSGVNYNTLVLGREGYMSMNMVTDRAAIEALKPTAHQMLAALAFDGGKRYADFDSKTDKIAEYGLAALVAGVAAKKLGLLAVIGVFIAKFAKVLIAAAVIGGGTVLKLFRRKQAAQSRDSA